MSGIILLVFPSDLLDNLWGMVSLGLEHGEILLVVHNRSKLTLIDDPGFIKGINKLREYPWTHIGRGNFTDIKYRTWATLIAPDPADGAFVSSGSHDVCVFADIHRENNTRLVHTHFNPRL